MAKLQTQPNKRNSAATPLPEICSAYLDSFPLCVFQCLSLGASPLAQSKSTALSLGQGVSVEDDQFSRSGRSALHVLCLPRQAPAVALTINAARAPPPTPPSVDCCRPMPILDHLIHGRATADFQMWKVGPTRTPSAPPSAHGRPRPQQ